MEQKKKIGWKIILQEIVGCILLIGICSIFFLTCSGKFDGPIRTLPIYKVVVTGLVLRDISHKNVEYIQVQNKEGEIYNIEDSKCPTARWHDTLLVFSHKQLRLFKNEDVIITIDSVKNKTL